MKLEMFYLKFMYFFQFLKWKIACRLNPGLIKTFVLPDQSLFEYPLNSVVGYFLYSGGFEQQELNFFMKSLKPGDIFLDIGANGGLYSVIASKIVSPTGAVYAFEPGKYELNLLSRNISLNLCKNITVIDKAVGNTSGFVKFAVSHDGAMSSLQETNHPNQSIKEWQLVNMISLDEFIQQSQIEKVDFIKIDVEGAEYLVFQGAERVLKSNERLTILFEGCESTSRGFGYSTKDLIDKVRDIGLTVYYFGENGELVQVIENNPDIGSKISNFVARNW